VEKRNFGGENPIKGRKDAERDKDYWKVRGGTMKRGSILGLDQIYTLSFRQPKELTEVRKIRREMECGVMEGGINFNHSIRLAGAREKKFTRGRERTGREMTRKAG